MDDPDLFDRLRQNNIHLILADNKIASASE